MINSAFRILFPSQNITYLNQQLTDLYPLSISYCFLPQTKIETTHIVLSDIVGNHIMANAEKSLSR